MRMSTIAEVEQPSYKILNWIGSGGFGQVFKVLRNGQIVVCKQIEPFDVDSALREHENLSLLRNGPGIARVHDNLEWNSNTRKLSIFMDYYEGRDLEQQILVLQASGAKFSEYQILGLGFQIARSLVYCHEQKILHQDMKPMNVLLEREWDPLTDPDVPDVYVADFGIASQVQTLATRYTQQRGTPSYEAPEIMGRDRLAAFSEKSDVYALGCILYRLCTLSDPIVAAGLSSGEIISDRAVTYSEDLLTLISAMLSRERDHRPTSTDVKLQFAKLLQPFDVQADMVECRTCGAKFSSRKKLRRHIKDAGHSLATASKTQAGLREQAQTGVQNTAPRPQIDRRMDITEAVDRSFGYDDLEPTLKVESVVQEPLDPSPCAVCMKQFNSKKGFFQHLHCGQHWRNHKYVAKRRWESEIEITGMKRKRPKA